MYIVNTMLEASYADLFTIDFLLTRSPIVDDCVLGIIGYHLQQCIGKALKALLEDVGQDYRSMGHSIGKYLCFVESHLPGVIRDEHVTVLRPYVNLLTDWETAGRYPSSFLFTLDELREVFHIAINVYNDCADYFGSDHFKPTEIKEDRGGLSNVNLFDSK